MNSENHAYGTGCIKSLCIFISSLASSVKDQLGYISEGCFATHQAGAKGERSYSSYSFLTSAPEGGEWSASRPDRALPPGKEPPVPTVQEAGFRGKSASKAVCTCLLLNQDIIQRSYKTQYALPACQYAHRRPDY
jgi:hypothetical protein